MAQELSGLQAELHTFKQEILAAVAGVASSVAELQQDVARIDATTRETDKKVQYLCDHLLGDADQRELRRMAGKR